MPLSPMFAFGPMLKHLRKHAGMTQRDLAAALGYSESLICSLETAHRQSDLKAVMERFVPALGLQDDPQTAAALIEQATLARGERPPASVILRRTTQVVVQVDRAAMGAHFPAPPTELIGRAAEVHQLCNRLLGHSGGLLTLVGPPGIMVDPFVKTAKGSKIKSHPPFLNKICLVRKSRLTMRLCVAILMKSISEKVFMSTNRYRRSTIVEVANRAGVSPATVSRVLNGTAVVVPDTEQRVRAAIDALNFSPHPAARQLLRQCTDTIGLLLPEISGHFFPPMLRGIEAELRDSGYDLLIHSTLDGRGRRPLTEHNTDGLLIFPGSVDDAELRRLSQIGFPAVLLHRTAPDGVAFPTVTVENRRGAAALVSHLIEAHGGQRIVYLRGPAANEDSGWREEGYRAALAAHGLPFDPALVAAGGFDDEQAFATVQALLAGGLVFDAVFAGDDDAAMGAMRAFRLAGRSLPTDVAVVGFDDVLVARYMSPALTTVHVPIEEVGRTAVRRLMNLIHDQPADVLTLLPTTLVIRQSCGCE